MNIDVEIKVINKKAMTLPSYATSGSAGMDLYAIIDQPMVVEPNTIVKIQTGIAIGIPNEFIVGLVYPRSGLSSRHGIALANCVGVIDSDYRGEIICPMINHSNKAYTIQPMDRIAQLVFTPIFKANFKPVEELDITCRNQQGFGSSGN